MSATLVGVTLEAVTCCNCGIVFGMESNYIRERKRDHKSWTCPNGHRQHWAQQSEADRLRDQLAREKHLREQADARARLRAAEAALVEMRELVTDIAQSGVEYDARKYVVVQIDPDTFARCKAALTPPEA